ncbi:flagellar hook-length control protein FliK [Pseudoxanthomonas mexicana]|uniref:flagellar hook-length control protein FliK n=1 Tax=Pseudoxanthomonas mexicana TaxID=128785 RepID=UPI00398AE4B7
MTNAVLNLGQPPAKAGNGASREAGETGAAPFERWMRPASATGKDTSPAARPSARSSAGMKESAPSGDGRSGALRQAQARKATPQDEPPATAGMPVMPPLQAPDALQPAVPALPAPGLDAADAMLPAFDPMAPVIPADALSMPALDPGVAGGQVPFGAASGTAPMQPVPPATPDAIASAVATALPQAAAIADGGNAAAPDLPLAGNPPLPAPAAATTTTLPGLLTFAQQLAAQPQAAAAPEILAPLRDLAERFDAGADADATPLLNAMAGTPTPALGLARTATVNPLEAPMPELRSEQFEEAIGTRLGWMAEQKIGHAHIRVNPNELGAIEIRLRLDGERVHADFSAAQPEVRQALENSLPRLREMLGQHGFQLAQADVGHRQQSDGRADEASAARGGGEDGANAGVEQAAPAPVRLIHRGLLDAYA